MKSVTAAHAAALGAWRTLEVGDRVGGIVFDDTKLDYVSPKRDRRTVQRLLSLISQRNQVLGPGKAEDGNQLFEALKQALQLVTHDFLVVVISDFHGFNDEIMKTMIQISKHNDLICAQVSDPAEAHLPAAKLVLTDGTYQTALGQHKRVRESLKKELGDWQLRLSSQLRRYGIPLIKFNTSDPVSKQLRKVVGGQVRIRKQR
jgi:uncharacterized protein (DUF58 family)